MTCRHQDVAARTGWPTRENPVKQFACGDVVPGCSRTFRGSEDEILSAAAAPVHDDHGMTNVPAGLVAQVRSRMVLVG